MGAVHSFCHALVLKSTAIFVLWPAHAFLIWSEDIIWNKFLGMKLSMPRSMAEIRSSPQCFMQVLQRHGVIPSRTEYVSISSLADIAAEPEKNQTAGGIELVHFSPLKNKQGNNKEQNDDNEPELGELHHLRLFCKFQSGRKTALWLQAIKASLEWGMSREVDFYNITKAHVPVCTPTPLLALKMPHINRVCVVLEHIDIVTESDTGYTSLTELTEDQWIVRPDWLGCSRARVSAMLAQVALMHGKYLDCTSSHRATRWLAVPKSYLRDGMKGIEFMSFIADLIKPVGPTYARVWPFIVKYFENHSVTLVHGDCRPGNMLFRQGQTDEVPQVMFCDWEATNIAPPAWDVTYAVVLGLKIADRRKWGNGLIFEYAEALLHAQGRDPNVMSRVSLRKHLDALMDDVHVLTLVLFCLAAVVKEHRLWEQGNTSKDMETWGTRMCAAVVDLPTQRVASLLGVDVKDIKKMQTNVEERVKDAPSSELVCTN